MDPSTIRQIIMLTASLVLGSQGRSREVADTNIVQVNLVSPRQAAAADSPGKWQHRKVVGSDLDGDGIQERVVILARVGTSSEGVETWDDGQEWEARIEEPDGTTTRVYAQYVQLGRLRGYINDGQGRPTLFLLEETSARVRGFEVTYHGPGKVNSQMVFERYIERSVVKEETVRK